MSKRLPTLGDLREGVAAAMRTRLPRCWRVVTVTAPGYFGIRVEHEALGVVHERGIDRVVLPGATMVLRLSRLLVARSLRAVSLTDRTRGLRPDQ